eukprot:CAMPEP_0179071218 /NCGR_PEP_ID=MMETSP0796-20121207/31419_1 /TAXON_ID=73915 /ORGANISM="Pyrodinium bahamense, Strain pbaha01" /LENGTH=42 /DNA_ID= /DNA_START= /DNA_END= /DNA_ORIENTATION=
MWASLGALRVKSGPLWIALMSFILKCLSSHCCSSEAPLSVRV